MNTYRMPLEEWIKVWTYLLLGCLAPLAERTAAARPRFDTSTDMGLVLVPADAEIDSVIFRLRATDQDADFPLIFDITATVTPVVRIENLPCTLYNKVCQANVILTRRLTPGRLHDFAVRVKDSKGDSNSMQATISVTNATTQRDKIFPHIPAIIMVPEDTKPGKELDYVLVRSNQWSGKPVYIELWQPKELFTIRQRQLPAETRGVITLIGELDFETQSMYTLTIYATDPYTEPKKDTRNIAGLHLVVVVQDVQDVPPIFTMAPPLTKINNTVKPGDVILRVHAEDGDKGVPREVTYGLVSEGNPFTPFFNITETTGEIILARPLEELTQITHVGAPVVLTVVAEEIRRSTMEPPAQATVVEVGLLLGEPGNSPPFFENDNYVAWMDENAEPGSAVTFTEHYSTKVRDEDIGKAGVFALKLDNNNGTFEISPAVAERTANFIITVRDNSLIDYEIHKSLRFKIIAQEVGPATNLSATVPATIFLRDINDNAPEFEVPSYEVTLSENATAGTRVTQVHATDKDTGSFGRIQYTRVIGTGSEAFHVDPDTGIITVAMETSALDREVTPTLRLSVEARDEDGKGLRGTVPLIVNLLDVNDNAPIFERTSYKFTLNEDLTNFTTMAILKACDADSEPPNNEIRYEIVHGNYENKFYLDEMTGELFLREPINKVRRTRHNNYQNFATVFKNSLVKVEKSFEVMQPSSTVTPGVTRSPETATDMSANNNGTSDTEEDTPKIRKKRADEEVLFTLTARAYDLGVPHLSGVTEVSVLKGPVAGARIVRFVVSGENPDPVKTADTLATITGGRINVLEIRPYISTDVPDGTSMNVPSLERGKKSIVVARVEPNGDRTSLVDIEKIRSALAANGVGVIDGDMPTGTVNPVTTNHNTNTNINSSISVTSEEVTIYKAENRLLFWLLIILGLLMLIALIALIICCICPGCPFYMAPRKRRVHSSETLIARSDGRPRRHLHRKHARMLEASWSGRKQAWSADPTRRNWQFNRRNQKAGGQASLPGDVRVIDRDNEIAEKTGSLRLRDGPVPMYFTDPPRRPDEQRIYMEDVEGLRGQGYDHADMELLAQRDVERSSDMARRAYLNEEEQRAHEHAKFVREQHFYRDGNAEVLRLVTRGQIEEGAVGCPAHRSLVIDQSQYGAYRIDGKDILLQRFIEDQKIRHAADVGHDLHDSMQDIERRSMESHHRQKEAVSIQQQQQQQQQLQQLQPHQQHQQVLLIPERLEEDHRQHIEELGPEVQRLIIDHGSFEKTARFESKDSQEIVPSATLLVHAPITKPLGEKIKEHASRQSVNVQHYSIHDLELARQNALLTRLLLERDVREVGAGAMVDSASYLETQSLPGQVAIATQTDRTAATQTELPSRSRSDNDESEEEARMRRKMKSKKRHGDGEPRRIRTLWMKSPIQEEDTQYCTEKRSNVLRKKIKDVKECRRISLEPEVLQAISDSLDENGETPITARRRDARRDDSNSREESRNDEESGRLEDSSSTDFALRDGRRIVDEKQDERSATDEEAKTKSHRGKNVVEPSFRILEREMSSLSKKLSKLAGKKILQYSNGSETDSHEQTKTVMTDLKKIEKKPETQVADGKIVSKGVEATKSKRSKSTSRTTGLEAVLIKEQTKIREEVVGEPKTRHLSKYRKMQTISTGSSDFEESVERVKKQVPMVTHAEKQQQAATKVSHIKLKRQNKVEHKEPTKTALLALAQEIAEQKDSSDSVSKGSIKSEKSDRDSMRMKKYSSGTSGGKTVSGSPSSDYSKDTKARRMGRPVVDAGKKRSAGTSEASSGKVSQEEIAMSVKSDAKKSGESTVIEIEGKRLVASELGMKIVPEGVEMQKSEQTQTPVLSPEVPELRMKIIDEAVGMQKSEKTLTPVVSPEVPDLTTKIAPESMEIRKREKILTPVLSPEVPELRMKITPEGVKIQKSEKTPTPVLSPEVPELMLKIAPENMEIQKNERILTPVLSPEVPELKIKIPPEVVEVQKSERTLTPVVSPEVPELRMKITPESVEIQKSEKILTPVLSPEVPELKMKITPEVVEVQKSERTLTPVVSPEVPELRMKITPESVEIPKSEKILTPVLSPEVPELKMKITPEVVEVQKSERTLTPVVSPEVPELRMKITPESVEIQKSEKILTPVLSPEVPEVRMKITPEKVEMQKREKTVMPVLSPEVPKSTMKIAPESVEIQKSEKLLPPVLSPEVPELRMKITPEGEVQKSEMTLPPVLSPEVPELMLKIAPEVVEIQKSGKILTPSLSPEMSELIKIVPQVEETHRSEKVLTPTLRPEIPELRMNIIPETGIREILQTPASSPEIPNLTTEIVSKSAETHKGETLQMLVHEKGTDEASKTKSSSPKTIEDKESPEPSEPIENQALTMPKEVLVDFLRHEMKDSMDSLQDHQHSVTDAVEKIKDICLASTSMLSEDTKTADDRQKEEFSEPIKSEKPNHFEEWEEVSTDIMSNTEHKTQDRPVIVAQESDDAGMFSDNFDSFCGTEMHPKNSLDTRGTEGEISYETLESESSEDRITDEIRAYTKHTEEKDHGPKSTEESEETTASEISALPREEETEKQSEELPTKPIPQSQSDQKSDSSKKPISRTPTPIPLELGTERAEIQISSSDIIDKVVPKLETDSLIPIQEPSDIPKHITEPEFPKVEELSSPSVKAHIDKVPRVPPLDTIKSDEKLSTRKEEPSEPKLTESEIRIASPELPSPSPAEINLETLLQKEFGIADSLFVDAKLLKVSPRSERKIVGDTEVKESGEETVDDIQKPIHIKVPPANLVELSGVMLDDGDDSDSSEASSKTMLTARPYGTPRHRSASTGTVEALEASESKSMKLEPTEYLSATDVSIKISPAPPKTGESIDSTQTADRETSPEKSHETAREKSPKIETETTTSLSGKINEKIIAFVQDPRSAMLPPVIPDQAEAKAVETDAEKEPETSSHISGGESKASDRTASPEEFPKTEASDKVQLYQIAQEKLPAVADGFASLPEMDEPLKSADVSKVTEEGMGLPVEMRRGAVIAKIVKTPGNGAKHAPSTGKETKRTTKKKEPSKEDVPKSTKKTATAPLKVSSPKREVKSKTMKEESSNIGKQSTVTGQFVRSRDTKRQSRPIEPQVEEQTDAPSRSDRNRRTWRKTDRPDKDVPQRDKGKTEKVKKSSSGGDPEKIKIKRPTEMRAKDEKPKDSDAKKIHEKAGKADKSKRSVSESKVEQPVKPGPVNQLDDHQTVKKPDDQHKKDDEERTVDFLKEEAMESVPIGKTEESIIPSPISSYPKANDDVTKDVEENTFSDESTGHSVEIESTFDNVADESVKMELSEDSEKDPREKESTMTEGIVKFNSEREPDKVHETPVASEQDVESAGAEIVAKDRAIQPEGTDDQAQGETEIVDDAEEETAGVGDGHEKPLGIATGKASSQRKATKPRRETETVVIESQSRYMEWYKQKREEMERKRRERKDTDEEGERPKWLRKSTRQRWFRSGPDDRKMFDPKIGETTPGRRKKIKPLVNVESEQLKAIVRQGRKLRKAQGETDDEPQIIIFAPKEPPTPRSSISVDPRYHHHHHHLVQHSEYGYEKMPVAPFYLHPPPEPHPSPQNFEDLGPEHYQSLPADSTCPAEGFDSGIIPQQPQAGGKLRHQQILEKKSVFDIAYSEAAPSHLRADSTTPPS